MSHKVESPRLWRVVDLAKDHEELSCWWTARGWAPIAPEMLPESGWMAVNEAGQPLAAIWAYNATGVPLAMIEFLVTNPDARIGEVVQGIERVIALAVEYCRITKTKAIFTTCKQPSLVRLYERNGFFQTDTGVTHLLHKF